jgi:hypothetical protein
MGYDDDEDEEMHTHLYVKKFIIFIFLFRVEQVFVSFQESFMFHYKKNDYEEKKNLS